MIAFRKDGGSLLGIEASWFRGPLYRTTLGVLPRVFSTENPTSERRPDRHSQVESLGHRQEFSLRSAFDQIILHRQRKKRRPAVPLDECIGLGHNPGGNICNAKIKHFARTYLIIKRSHDFFYRSEEAPGMDHI